MITSFLVFKNEVLSIACVCRHVQLHVDIKTGSPWLLKETLKLYFQAFRLQKTQARTYTDMHLFHSLGRLSSGWKNIGVAAVKVGSRHGSVIPVLAENPNYPEEQSAVVMCGQSLKTNLSSPAPTCVPPTNTGPKTGRQRCRQTGRKRKRDTEESTVTVMM